MIHGFGCAPVETMPVKVMTDWENCYQTGQIFWDKGTPSPSLQLLAEKHPGLFKGRVLVPGCGLGHDARWLAAHGCEVTAVDIAPTAIAKARELDPAHRVNFQEADLFDLPHELRGAFDIVWEHTCLSAMAPELRERYALGIKSALKSAGIVAAVFYINPDLDPGETGPPYPISVDELEDLWRSVGLEISESWVPEAAYPGREGRERVMILGQSPQAAR